MAIALCLCIGLDWNKLYLCLELGTLCRAVTRPEPTAHRCRLTSLVPFERPQDLLDGPELLFSVVAFRGFFKLRRDSSRCRLFWLLRTVPKGVLQVGLLPMADLAHVGRVHFSGYIRCIRA